MAYKDIETVKGLARIGSAWLVRESVTSFRRGKDAVTCDQTVGVCASREAAKRLADAVMELQKDFGLAPDGDAAKPPKYEDCHDDNDEDYVYDRVVFDGDGLPAHALSIVVQEYKLMDLKRD